MKQNADWMHHVAPLALKVGDMDGPVSSKELCPAYNPDPYKIIAIKGSMVTAKRNDHVITRNSSHFKTLPANENHLCQSGGLVDEMSWTGLKSFLNEPQNP
ncbi:hypothetical protein ABVT39_005672 [Epinephelus coioides]